MDALFIGWKKKPVYQLGISPNKLMDYMMSGKPVVHAVEAGNDLVVESGCGYSVGPEDPAGIAAAVAGLIHLTPTDRQAMGRRGREYILKHHDYRVLAQRFLDIMTPSAPHAAAAPTRAGSIQSRRTRTGWKDAA
jgi:glycosyltransferase involved in cell wall biosynthesis